ncbi:MAG: polysaccharide deacetylase family protein [Elusimicrobiota bacterium]
MKTALKNIFYGTLHGVGLTALVRLKNRAQVPVLIYHGVTDDDRDDALDVERVHIKTAGLRRHLEFIARHYRVVPLSRLADALRGGPALPPYSLALTFDDGYENNFTAAYPLLKEFAMPATFFLSTDFVNERIPLWVDRLKSVFRATELAAWTDLSGRAHLLGSIEERAAAYLRANRELKELDGGEHEQALERIETELLEDKQIKLLSLFNPLTKKQIREMASSELIEFGSHACRHRLLSKLPPEEVARELTESRRIVSELSGTETVSFSYPNGDFDRGIMAAVEKAGYTSAVAGGLCLNRPQRTSPYAVARVALAEDDSEALIAATLCGIRERLLALRGHPQIEHYRRHG